MAQLAQAYMHLKPYEVSARRLRSLGKVAESLASDVAKEIYGGGVTIDIELEEGSLRVRVTVVGALAIGLGVYSTVADYKGFKESVVELCNDARRFAVDVCEPLATKSGASPTQVHRLERRLKTPGKLYRLVKRIERLENSVSELSPKDMQRELSIARHELSRIAEDLTPEDMKAVEGALTKKHLPPPSKWPSDFPMPPKAALKEEQFLFEEAGNSLETSFLLGQQRRLVYRNRIHVEAELPLYDPQADRGVLPLQSPD